MRNVGYVLAPATPSSKIGIIARGECNYKTDVIQTWIKSSSFCV